MRRRKRGPRPTMPRPIRSVWRAMWLLCSRTCGPWLIVTPNCTPTEDGFARSWSRRGGAGGIVGLSDDQIFRHVTLFGRVFPADDLAGVFQGFGMPLVEFGE